MYSIRYIHVWCTGFISGGAFTAHSPPPPPDLYMPPLKFAATCFPPLEQNPDINLNDAHMHTFNMQTFTHTIILFSLQTCNYTVILLSQSITSLSPSLSLSLSSSLPLFHFSLLVTNSVKEALPPTIRTCIVHPQLMCVSCDNHLTSFKLSGCISR